VTEQTENLTRVKSRIAPAVIEFCRGRVGARFHLAELVAFVAGRFQGAPDSPSRILRDLRAARVLDYTVISRRASLYFVASVAVADGT
jgi:hypothetical protein